MKGRRSSIALLLLLSCSVAHSQTKPATTPLPMIYYQPGCWHMGPTAQMPQYIVMPEEMCPDSADLLIEEARRHLGKPYHYGGKGPKVFDCAGFARYVYMKFGFTLPGGSVPQYRLGRNIKDRTKLQKGDLVFFQGRSGKGGVGHTGIVTEVDTNTGVFRFIHAAVSTGVIISYSTEAYYAKRYIGARRLLGDRQKAEDPLPRKNGKNRK